jgi:CHAD domain-containing protein
VLAALDSRRYLALLDRLVDAATAPQLLAAADAPAAEVVPVLAGTAFGRLRTRVAKLGRTPSDDKLHATRILAKKARYAADVAVPVVGKPAAKLAKALGKLQDVLGDLHDCAVAEAWLTDAARGATRAQAFALGQLVAGQRHEAARLRGEWRAAWKAADEAKLTRWMAG